MSGHRRGHGPQRGPHEHPPLVAVRRAGRGCYELALSPGASVPELVAAAGILPPGVVYTAHRPAAAGQPAALLVFQAPPADPGGVTAAHPAPAGGPSPLHNRRLPEAGTDPAGGTQSVTEEAPAALVTPAAFATHGRHVVHGLTHRDPDALATASDCERSAQAPFFRAGLAHHEAPRSAVDGRLKAHEVAAGRADTINVCGGDVRPGVSRLLPVKQEPTEVSHERHGRNPRRSRWGGRQAAYHEQQAA